MREPQFYFSGGGLSALAGAACLVRELGFPGSSVHILEDRPLLPDRDGRIELLFSRIALPGIDLTVQRELRESLLWHGVDFRPGWAVTRLDFEESDEITVTALHCAAPGRLPRMVQLHEGDLCLVSLGFPLERAALGDFHTPPSVSDELPASVRFWTRLAKRSPAFGNPAPFFRSPEETGRVLFAVPLEKDAAAWIRHTGVLTDGKAVLPDSPWKLSVWMESGGPRGRDFLRGCGAYGRPGQFVKKPMQTCSGREILSELYGLAGFGESTPLPDVKDTLVCAVPWLEAASQCCAPTDRPAPIPEHSANLAFLGPLAGRNASPETASRSACDTVRQLANAL